jgi:hypothetical protein
MQTIKPIKNYEYYYVSVQGKIFHKEKELMSEKRVDGYRSIKLAKSINGKRVYKNFLIHRLVAEAFISNSENYPLVNHINNKRDDNRVENLEWCTYKHNTMHAWSINAISKYERKIKRTSKEDGSVKKYSSLTTASDDTGYQVYQIWRWCNKKREDDKYEWDYDDNKICITENVMSWVEIKGFPGYRISKDGRIYTEKRNKIMREHRTNYSRVKLFQNNKAKMRFIQCLVAEAYIPNPENKPQVNHKNGNHFDNRVENLEWMTAKENSQHSCSTGLRPPPKGKRVTQYNDNWEKICDYPSLKTASAATGAPTNTIRLVCNSKRQLSGGYRWKWVDKK